MRLDAATPGGTVKMDQTNSAVSIVFFFYIFWRLSLSHSERNVKVSYTFKTKKKEKLLTENPTFTIIFPEQGNRNINFDAHYMQWISHPSSLDTELRWYGDDCCDDHNHFNNEWTKLKFVTELALSYVMYWAIWSLINYFKNDNFRTRVIPRHCLNRLSKLTTKKSTYKLYQRR